MKITLEGHELLAAMIVFEESRKDPNVTAEQLYDRCLARGVRLLNRGVPLRPQEPPMTSGAFLERVWRDLRDDASNESVSRFQGAASALAAIGALSADEHELWLRRIKTCPGHDDEGGRDWCAYCGEMSGAT